MDFQNIIHDSSRVGVKQLLDKLSEKEDLTEYDDYKLGSILNGKLEAIKTIREIIEGVDFKDEFIRDVISDLKKGSENTFEQLSLIMKSEIESDSTKLMAISKTKALSFSAMYNISETIKELDRKIKSGDTKLGKQKNLSSAERFAINKRNG